MNAIFHRAKHWQLFSILIGTPLLFQLIGMVYMSSTFSPQSLLDGPPELSGFFWIFIPMMFIVLFLIFGWQWSIGSGLKDKLPRSARLNFKLYRAFTIVPIVYFIAHISFVFVMFSRMENAFYSGNPFEMFQLILPMLLGMALLIPFALFASFCMFYGFYFCAKTLKSIELGREAELNDYIGYFFLFWFNFVGFWIIQPSVNRITSEDWVPPPTPPGYEPLVGPGPDTLFAPIPEKEKIPPGAKMKTRNHEAFDHDDDFDGLF